MSKSKKQVAISVYKRLKDEYPNARCTLDNLHPHHFLYANIISPQVNDEMANMVSTKLWNEYEGTETISEAPLEKIKEIIRPAGFYNVKAKHIKESAKLLINEFDSELPDTVEELIQFPGIGRKTALVILAEVFNKVEGIVIDTHNIRIAQRLGLTDKKTPEAIENDLRKLLHKRMWRKWSSLMVFHGREICTARSPRCGECALLDLCEYENKNL